jgi:hypothetical protein
MRKLMMTIALGVCMVPALAGAAEIYIGPSGPPPAARVEVARPRPGYVWVGGHYGWHHRHGYRWTRGHYVRERSGWAWQDGAWRSGTRHYEWHPGHWERTR